MTIFADLPLRRSRAAPACVVLINLLNRFCLVRCADVTVAPAAGTVYLTIPGASAAEEVCHSYKRCECMCVCVCVCATESERQRRGKRKDGGEAVGSFPFFMPNKSKQSESTLLPLVLRFTSIQGTASIVVSEIKQMLCNTLTAMSIALPCWCVRVQYLGCNEIQYQTLTAEDTVSSTAPALTRTVRCGVGT